METFSLKVEYVVFLVWKELEMNHIYSFNFLEGFNSWIIPNGNYYLFKYMEFEERLTVTTTVTTKSIVIYHISAVEY